jgi:hypothetical protein
VVGGAGQGRGIFLYLISSVSEGSEEEEDEEEAESVKVLGFLFLAGRGGFVVVGVVTVSDSEVKGGGRVEGVFGLWLGDKGAKVEEEEEAVLV